MTRFELAFSAASVATLGAIAIGVSCDGFMRYAAIPMLIIAAEYARETVLALKRQHKRSAHGLRIANMPQAIERDSIPY